MEFNDQDLRLALNRALRNVMIAALVGIPIVWIAWGWRSVVLFLIGAAIAATGIFEWRQLMSAVLVRLDTAAADGRKAQRPLGSVLFWFFVRLAAVGAVLYVSLRSLDGNVAGLIIGICLALISLVIEALRMFRGWSA